MKWRWLLVAALALACSSYAQNKARPGLIQFSNGESLEGLISLTPGAELRLHVDGKQIRTLSLDKVSEMRWSIESERMDRKWRFVEAGQARKEYYGQPYLIRSLKTTLLLGSGETIAGHLYTTVFYVESEGKVQKVVVLAKQTGKEGEGADALKYPTLIRFTDTPVAVANTIRVRLNPEFMSDNPEVALVTWGALMTSWSKKPNSAGEFVLESPLGNAFFLAVRNGEKITCGWPANRDEKLWNLVQTNMQYNEDFYDQRQLLGVYHDKPAGDLYSLVMMHRTGKTTLEGRKTQPWRLVIQRWKYDEDSQKVLLAGRGFFFRGILEKGQHPPPVELTQKLWRFKNSGGVWVAE